MSERTCSKCGQVKPETEQFFRRRGNNVRGGLRPDCRECCAKRDREYYRQNQDKVRAYREANTARLATYQASYMAGYSRTRNGKAARRRATLNWLAKPEGRLSQALAQRRRRARKAGAQGVFTATEWSACKAAFDNQCAYCGQRVVLTQDHVIPLTRGGAHDPGNIVPACLPCNSSKKTKPIDDWYRRQPFYSEERLMRVYTYLGAVA